MTSVANPPAAVPVRLPLAPEEETRANLYALLARLFSRAPDTALLRALGSGPRLPEHPLAPWPAAYNRLADASSVMDADAGEQEYTDLFVGVGRSEVDLHASHWLIDASSRPLAELRTELAGLGLGRLGHAALLEDHLGPLLETMRLLIAGDPNVAPASLAVQRGFFGRWLDPWTDRCCNAIDSSSIANYYRRVAECTKALMAIERDSFALE